VCRVILGFFFLFSGRAEKMMFDPRNHQNPVAAADAVRHIEDGCPYRADDVMDAEKGVSTGTTIVAVSYDGGVIMGADSRTSTGSYIANRVSRKVTKVHDKIYVCRSGSAADTQALTSYVQHYIGQHALMKGESSAPTVNACASLFQMLAYNNKDRLMAGLIVGGHDEENGGSVYVIPLGGAMMKVPWTAGGSGSGYIQGLMDAEWRPGMSEKECRDAVKKWIAHAMARDGSSGGCIRTVSINAQGVNEDFTAGDELPYAAL